MEEPKIYICSSCWWTMLETTLAYDKTTETPSQDRISLACVCCHRWAIIPKE